MKCNFNFLPDGELLKWGRGHETELIAFRKGLVEGSYALKNSVRGDETLSAEPFADLTLPLASLWA